jgi:hypothetical protein
MDYCHPIIPLLYDEARTLIKNGYIGLARPDSFEGRAITRATRAVYSHATLFGWATPATLMVGETREHKDARLIDARSEIFRSPAGCYDVFRVLQHSVFQYNGNQAWEFVCHAAGCGYSWHFINRVFWRRSCGLTWVTPIANSDLPQWPRDCSGLVHAALRSGGGPQVKAFDCDVEPGDLCDPCSFEYLFTLFSTDEQIERFLEQQEDSLRRMQAA